MCSPVDLPSRSNSLDQMEISELASNDDSSLTSQYDIIIRQQPIHARACGFGTRDRRAIDPPPILQMMIRDPDASPAEIDSKMRCPFSVVHCELWNAVLDIKEAATLDLKGRRRQRGLIGTLVAHPFIGRDESDVEGCFFPFPDLSCRTPGKYRLKFVLVVLNPANMGAGERLHFKATVLSHVFEVYPAKSFPGTIESTELTKLLKEQGCLISIKKGHQGLGERRGTHSEEKDAEQDDDDMDLALGLRAEGEDGLEGETSEQESFEHA